MLNFFWGGVALGLCCCAQAFCSCGQGGLLFVAVCGLLIEAASLVVEHGLQARRLSSCGARTQLLRGMWDLPGPGIEPVSPALAGGFFTTAPPGKSQMLNLKALLYHIWLSHCFKLIIIQLCCSYFCKIFTTRSKILCIFYAKRVCAYLPKVLVLPGRMESGLWAKWLFLSWYFSKLLTLDQEGNQ